jgi:hypothetical protein
MLSFAHTVRFSQKTVTLFLNSIQNLFSVRYVLNPYICRLIINLNAVPLSWQLDVTLSPPRHGFHPRPVRRSCVVKKWPLGYVSLRIFSFYPVGVSKLMLHVHVHLHLHATLIRRVKERSLGKLKVLLYQIPGSI